MEEVKLIVNPIAGGGTIGKHWPRIRRILRAEGLEFEASLSEGKGHAAELARQALNGGYQTVVALGGDGTVNEVINGLMAEGAVDPEVALGIIPGEKGNDLARTLGIPFDYAKACRKLLKGKPVPLDLGKITYTHHGSEARRYFINIAGLGFDGEVVRRVTLRLRGLSNPKIRYLSGLLLTLATYKSREARITLDGKELSQRAFTIVVCNGRYFAGGMEIAPQAEPNDGLFDLIVIGDFAKWELLANLSRAYRGTHLFHPKVKLYRAKEIKVWTEAQEAGEGMLLQADGELLGETPANFELIPGAIRVLI
ncbi:MAG: diacylglycerol/lipid kinase family protein [Candidatus Bipolaricaulia bacterium]